jgi:hypothetical protein
MSSKSTAFFARNRYVPCGRDGARVGIYVVSFYDCPHCMNLLSSYRFRLYTDFIRRQYKTAVVRLIIQPKSYGLRQYEFIADDFDRCIANFALWLARHQGYGYINAETGQFWLQSNAMSPIILLVPPEPKVPIVLPLELLQYLLASKPGKPDWEFAMKYAVSYITGKIYTPPPEETRRRRVVTRAEAETQMARQM